MRELKVDEIEEVNGGWAWIAVGAVANGLYEAWGACVSGGNVGRAFTAGAASGALMSTGIGLAGKGVQVAGNTYKSITAGTTAFGAGGAVNTLK